MKIHQFALFTLALSLLWATGLFAGAVYAESHASVVPAYLHAETPATISPFLLDEVAVAQGPVSFLAILADQPAPIEHAAQVSGADSPEETRAAVYAYLTAHADATQMPLRAWLDAHGIGYRAYYLVNMLEIEGDVDVILALANRPEIDRLVANPLIEGDTAGNLTVNPADAESSELTDTLNPLPTGINYTRAPDVWALGFRGRGIVVAGGDTGVEWNHPGLVGSYRGWNPQTQAVNHTNHWLDAWRAEDQAASTPTACANATGACDDWGHGTHTLGTIVAQTDPSTGMLIGMAPDARWIACRNMRANFGTPAKYIECFQFFLAPYPQGGNPSTDGNPALGAHIVNNSWGCPPVEGCDADSLRNVIENLRAAGVFVVSSAGNSGLSGCSTVNNPPGIHAGGFTVGAHNLIGAIAPFSSRGPVTVDGSGRLKPNLTAPGVDIYSTVRNGAYATLSGTSMAAPHVSGAVALLWSAVPSLRGNIALTEEILVKSATPVFNNSCDAGQPPIVPNNTYGYGRLDAFNAVRMALTPWQVRVRVLNPQGAPIAQAQVVLQDELTGTTRTATTNAQGWAQWNGVYQGAYTCRVELPPQQVGTRSISLQPTPLPGAGSQVSQGSLTVGSCQLPGQADPDPTPPATGPLYVPAVTRS